MAKKIITRWLNENGDLYRVGRHGARYFIETITPAWEPHAGEVSRQYVSKDEADAFDPDPLGELCLIHTP